MTSLLAQVSIPGDFFSSQPPGVTSLGSSLGRFVSALIPNIIVAAGVVFFFLIVGAGFSLIAGAGVQKSPQETAKAKAALTWGIMGFLLVISAYFILQIVSTMIFGPSGTNFLNPSTF